VVIIDSAKEQLASKQMLVEIHETFQKSEVQGILHLCQKAPQCLKFFLFELFSDEESHESTIIGSLSQLVDMMPTLNILDEGLICGVAFLLRRAFSLFIHEQLLAK